MSKKVTVGDVLFEVAKAMWKRKRGEYKKIHTEAIYNPSKDGWAIFIEVDGKRGSGEIVEVDKDIHDEVNRIIEQICPLELEAA